MNDHQAKIEQLERKVKYLEDKITVLNSVENNYQKLSMDTRERIKELNCIYDVAKIIVDENDAKKAVNEIISKIPYGFKYDDIVRCRITINDNIYHSQEFEESPWMLKEDIICNNQMIGFVEIFYARDMPKEYEGPFLFEEYNLLKGISRLISLFIKQQNENENRKLIQQQLLHADRLATIGQLAAGVAHELNEPLGNILGFAQLAKKCNNNMELILSDLSKIEESCLYARTIISKLLDFARQSPLKIEKIDLNDEIKKSAYFLEARCHKEGIKFKREYSNQALNVNCDPNQIKQIITNLVINAIQAIHHGNGSIILKTEHIDGKAVISIEDNGDGITATDIDKIFMPFFTTKDIG
ncbi:MAG: hypothetical protein KAQ98_12460, partial [Bacteriovoracaceae bacterium]|nr:hypothetical protein [Bacteriovoracaceae bacterium]